MLFNYESSDFEGLRKTLYDFFIFPDTYLNVPENTQELKHLFIEILDKENIAQLSKLDNKNLLYNSWGDIDKAVKGNYLSQDNSLFYEIHRNGEIIQSQISKIYSSLFLVLYADFYEGSLSLENEYDKNYFYHMSNKLLYLSENLLEIDSRKLSFLWMEIPRNIFDKHLGKHLDRNVLETVELLRSNQEFIKEKISISNRLKQDIEEIKNLLEEQKSGYNFVGLSKGFTFLKDNKATELNSEKVVYRWLMGLIILMIIAKSAWSAYYLNNNDFNSPIFIIITISTLLFLFVLLYFFRISLANVKSIKSQILQIDLRLTLCQFIHNYETDTSKLRDEKMKDSFDKFESVIFAPIVATEDQMPATFDGLEQLTGLLGSFNRSPK